MCAHTANLACSPVNRNLTPCLVLVTAMLFGHSLPKYPTHIGCIDPQCDVLSIAKDAQANAQFLCEQYYMTAPMVEYKQANINREYQLAV